MRTEKTEFGHIDEIIRRIALARFDVTINLSHNGKVMRQYRAVAEGGQKERRLGPSAVRRFWNRRWPLSGSTATGVTRLGCRSKREQCCVL